jgi:hypothetical protein
MRGKLLFLGGLAAGFVLGTRAGREKYEEIVQAARKVRDNPTVQEATGVVQAQANRMMSTGKEIVADKLSNSKFAETPLGEKVLSAVDTDAGAHAIKRNEDTETLAATGTTGTTGTTGANRSGNTTGTGTNASF